MAGSSFLKHDINQLHRHHVLPNFSGFGPRDVPVAPPTAAAFILPGGREVGREGGRGGRVGGKK